jgi:hypothetical protein
VLPETIVPLTAQPAPACADGAAGHSATTRSHAAGRTNLTVPSSVADAPLGRIRQYDDSYFGSNLSATPFIQ